MQNEKKFNVGIPNIFPDFKTNNMCGSCPHRNECLLYNALDEKTDPSYSRTVRDFLNDPEEVKIDIFSCPCHDGEKSSTTKGLFGYKRWYPTYLILLCIRLVIDFDISPADIVNIIFADIETKIPSVSTIYRWVKEYKEYMKSPKKSKHADVFNPVEALKKLCQNSLKAVKYHSISDLYNHYINALQKVFGIPKRFFTFRKPS